MAQVRSARGEFVDFELLAIKAQLASVPVPKQVDDRRTIIEERDGAKPTESPAIDELLKVAAEAATVSANKAPKKK